MASVARRRVAATASFTVRFGSGSRAKPEPQDRILRVARMLALAHQIERRVQTAEFRDYAHAAKANGVTRARLTQITNLLLLAPAIQEAILDLPLVTNGRDPITERALRRIVAEVDWERQRELWNEVKS